MKRIISTLMIFVLVISVCILPVSAMSSKTKKYTKVKTTELKKYKKAYKENKKLNNKIKAKNDEIKQLKKQLKEKNEKYKSEKSKNNWIWNNLWSIGINYGSKKWTIPKTICSKYMIDGVVYRAEWE